jgi:hypothetical protein
LDTSVRAPSARQPTRKASAAARRAAAKKAAARQEATRKAAGLKRAAVRNLVSRAAELSTGATGPPVSTSRVKSDRPSVPASEQSAADKSPLPRAVAEKPPPGEGSNSSPAVEHEPSQVSSEGPLSSDSPDTSAAQW